MTSSELLRVAGVILSLLFFYVPGLRDWYGAQDGRVKAGVMLALVLLVAAGGFAMACAQLAAGVTCDARGAFGLLQAVLETLIANQATYLVARRFAPAPKRLSPNV